jgi:hypothetical protein
VLPVEKSVPQKHLRFASQIVGWALAPSEPSVVLTQLRALAEQLGLKFLVLCCEAETTDMVSLHAI